VRGNYVKPKKLAAPMYFEFGWQIYNSVSERQEVEANVVSTSNGDGCVRE